MSNSCLHTFAPCQAVFTGVSEAFMMPIGRSVMLRRGQLRMCDGKDKKDSDGMMQRVSFRVHLRHTHVHMSTFL